MEKIRINTHGGPMPEKHGDWYDLCTAEDAWVMPHYITNISLGVSMELPKGSYAMVVPRSSTPKNWGILLANGVGIIDNDYCGDGDVWRFPAICLDNREQVHIPKGTRIAQFTIFHTKEFTLEQVDALGNKDRGGFGSTGK